VRGLDRREATWPRGHGGLRRRVRAVGTPPRDPSPGRLRAPRARRRRPLHGAAEGPHEHAGRFGADQRLDDVHRLRPRPCEPMIRLLVPAAAGGPRGVDVAGVLRRDHRLDAGARRLGTTGSSAFPRTGRALVPRLAAAHRGCGLAVIFLAVGASGGYGVPSFAAPDPSPRSRVPDISPSRISTTRLARFASAGSCVMTITVRPASEV